MTCQVQVGRAAGALQSGHKLLGRLQLVLLCAFGLILETDEALAAATNGPPAETVFVSVYQNQQHFAYRDHSGNVEDAFFDGSTWHLQKINNGGVTGGPAASAGPFVSTYQNQQHFAWLDPSGNIDDAFFDGSKWHLQRVNNGGTTSGPAAAGSLFVSVYQNQQHFAYLDRSGNIEDAFFDGSTWHLQRINNGGTTSGPPAAGNLFVSVYQHAPIVSLLPQQLGAGPTQPGLLQSTVPQEQHFVYLDHSGNIEDAFFDGSRWHLQRINNGGTTSGPAAAGNLFVSVYGVQQHFAYSDTQGDLEDAFYDGGSSSWHLQKLNGGANTPGLPVAGQVFVSVYQKQQHFAYIDYRDVIDDAFFDSNNWQLQQLTTQLPTTTTSVPIQYVVMAVVYAPPGSAAPGAPQNLASYTDGSTLGTSSSVSKSFKSGYGVSADVQALGSEASASFSTSKDTTDSSEIDVSKSSSYGININGAAQDGIDHDLDEIWLILNPVMKVSVTGKNVAWALTNSGTQAQVQYVTVGWLKNPSTMLAGVATALRNAGITPAQYPELLKRDPFANGATSIDTNRFIPTNTSFPYELATTSEPYTMSNDLTNKSSSSVTAEDDYSVSVKSGFSVGIASASLTISSSFSWTNTSSYGTTTESKQQASTTIAGPSTNWAGGTNIDVYYDTVYSSFLFAFDPDSVPTARDMRASVKGNITNAGQPVAHEEVLLTVGGQKFRTYTNAQGAYYFYRKPRGAASIAIRGLSRPISIGVAPVVHNRELRAVSQIQTTGNALTRAPVAGSQEVLQATGPGRPAPSRLLLPPPSAAGAASAGCAPSYPQAPAMPGTRVLFVTSSSAVQGAQVYLDGKCQGVINQEAPGRAAYSLMLVNVPTGQHAVAVRMQGYRDFQAQVNVVPSTQPPQRTPKVVVRFQLQR